MGRRTDGSHNGCARVCEDGPACIGCDGLSTASLLFNTRGDLPTAPRQREEGEDDMDRRGRPRREDRYDDDEMPVSRADEDNQWRRG